MYAEPPEDTKPEIKATTCEQYVPTGPFADGCRPDDVQSTCNGIERWNGHCDDWEGIFNHG